MFAESFQLEHSFCLAKTRTEIDTSDLEGLNVLLVTRLPVSQWHIQEADFMLQCHATQTFVQDNIPDVLEVLWIGDKTFATSR